ncbi:MAG: hypothetical protein IKO21_09145 [Fibrobacter sp.]|jgi:hypothetical protein|nr:hypothetical protein [Fibrobacter sp.]
MNLKEEKKKYIAPTLSLLDMRGDLYLLSCSGGDCDVDQGEYDDEFGFKLNQGTDRHV